MVAVSGIESLWDVCIDVGLVMLVLLLIWFVRSLLVSNTA